MTFLFLVPNLSFFSKDFKKNFECQVGSGVQNKIELWLGVTSFYGAGEWGP